MNPNPTPYLRSATLAASLLALTACGGGGSDSTTTTPTVQNGGTFSIDEGRLESLGPATPDSALTLNSGTVTISGVTLEFEAQATGNMLEVQDPVRITGRGTTSAISGTFEDSAGQRADFSARLVLSLTDGRLHMEWMGDANSPELPSTEKFGGKVMLRASAAPGGGGSDDGSGSGLRYEGPRKSTLRRVLEVAEQDGEIDFVYSTDDAIAEAPTHVAQNSSAFCIRDVYIMQALVAFYTAEVNYRYAQTRTGDDRDTFMNSAGIFAENGYRELEKAEESCSDQATVGGGGQPCATSGEFWSCEKLRVYLSRSAGG